MGRKIPLILIFFLIIPVNNSNAQENIFVEGSAVYHFIPDIMKDLLKSKPGGRLAFGFDYNNFLFALESGYSNMTGTNLLMEKITFVPVVSKFGYLLQSESSLGLQAYLSLGIALFKIDHYKTAIDMNAGRITKDEERSFLGGLRLYATLSPRERIKFYAGGGADIIFEQAGPIPLAVIEAGISVRPFKAKTKTEDDGRQMPAPQEIVFESREENIIVEETAQGRSVRLLNAVYFEADSSVMIERYRPILNEAAERLRANPSLRITLRGYAAPFGTAEGLAELSSARARYCADYLATQYGISESRIRIESFGAERAPALRDATWDSYRCVELILY